MQQRVSAQVRIFRVDPFEVINIKQDYGNGFYSMTALVAGSSAIAERSADFLTECVIKQSPVAQASEGVVGGMLTQSLAQTQICYCESDVIGHSNCQPALRFREPNSLNLGLILPV
jgi:hypothetical protein